MKHRGLSRRRFLAVAGTGAGIALAGCLGGEASGDLDSFDPAERPALGEADAPVRVAVFEDFSCPGCQQFKAQFTPQIVSAYVETGEAVYFHADFPLPVDETWSYAVASAARAVFEEAGNDAFWGFASAIYEHQGSYAYDVIEETADEYGVGAEARAAAENETHRDWLDDDREQGEEWGVEGTPTVLVDGDEVETDLESIFEAIESAL